MAKKKNVRTVNSQKHEILAPRLKDIPETELNERQRAMLNDIRTTRGAGTTGGPFGVFLHAPDYGDLAQKLGAHCRYRTAVPPHLSEFAILAIARLWRAQYEWHAHAPVAAKAGVRPETIRDLKAGRTPARLSKDERAIFDFIGELHRTRRVSERTYARVHALFGDAGMVEFTGLLGYYTLVAMTLNVFRVPLPEGATPAFAEPGGRRPARRARKR